jgi:methanogenic corrinoid protein MtbC1
VEQTSWENSAGSPVRTLSEEGKSAFSSCDLSLEQFSTLAQAIQTEVVPRILLRHDSRKRSRASADPSPEPAEIEEFARIVPLADESRAAAFVDQLRARGVSLETIYLELFAPVARRLGEYWTSDALTFTEVTLGLWRLHQLVRDLSYDFHGEMDRGLYGLQALLLPSPGEQHTFGLLMVAEFFRRSGWNVTSGPFSSGNEIARQSRNDWFAIVGFSVSRDDQLDAVASGIRAVRSASRNRGIGVLVGGRVFVEHPEFVKRVGADATAVDGKEAVAQAQKLVSIKESD